MNNLSKDVVRLILSNLLEPDITPFMFTCKRYYNMYTIFERVKLIYITKLYNQPRNVYLEMYKDAYYENVLGKYTLFDIDDWCKGYCLSCKGMVKDTSESCTSGHNRSCNVQNALEHICDITFKSICGMMSRTAGRNCLICSRDPTKAFPMFHCRGPNMKNIKCPCVKCGLTIKVTKAYYSCFYCGIVCQKCGKQYIAPYWNMKTRHLIKL